MLLPQTRSESEGAPTERRIRVYGLTGGTGSGKSEVARVFLDKGIAVVSADRIAHELIQSGGAAVDAVIEAFGERVVTQGAIDRKKVADIVFSDPSELARLNAIMHPLIAERIHGGISRLEAEGHRVAVVDAALIAEEGVREDYLDGLLVVHSSEEVRMRRLMEFRGMTLDEARARIAAQTPPEQKLPLADRVIENEGTLEELRVKAEAVAKELLDGAE